MIKISEWQKILQEIDASVTVEYEYIDSSREQSNSKFKSFIESNHNTLKSLKDQIDENQMKRNTLAAINIQVFTETFSNNLYLFLNSKDEV